MNVSEYDSKFWNELWNDNVVLVTKDLCNLIMTVTKIEDSKFSYSDEEYLCNIQCIKLFMHCVEHLGWLASNFLATYILFKDAMPQEQLSVTIELNTINFETYEVCAASLPTFIFQTLLKLCGFHLDLICWQHDIHCFFGYISIYLLAKTNWSDHDSQPMVKQSGFMKRLMIDTEPMSIHHLNNNRFNTSHKSGTSVTVERVHGYFNLHNVRAFHGNVQHTKNALMIQCYKKTLIAIFEETHEINTNSSTWHQVTVHQSRNSILRLFDTTDSIITLKPIPYSDHSKEIQLESN